jgi:hypothetical protein
MNWILMSGRGCGGQEPPSPTSTAGPARRDIGESHLVRGRSVVLIWKSFIATSANQVNSHGYLTKRGTDR